jgi:hypothetical protein
VAKNNKKIIVPELMKEKIEMKERNSLNFPYRNYTISELRKEFPYDSNMWHVSKADIASKIACDECRGEIEIDKCEKKRPILENLGWTYSIENYRI